MRKLLIITMLAPSCLFGQNKISDYKGIVKQFYQILYSKDPDSIAFTKLYGPDTPMGCHQFLSLCKLKTDSNDTLNVANYRKMKENPSHLSCYYQMTQDLTLNALFKIVDQAVLYEDYYSFIVDLDLNFLNKKSIHFEMSTENPTQILGIWLNNGDDLGSILLNEKPAKLERVGIINDPRGFCYVREKPDDNSKIAGEFFKNELFSYTPVGDSDWWPVYKDTEPLKIMGYLPKRKVLVYKNFPSELKKMLLKMPQG